MHQNTRGKVRFLGNLLFRRYSKFDGPIFGGGGQGKYIRGWGVTFGGELIGLHICGAYLQGKAC